MAEKTEKKMTVSIEGKYILAAFDVPKSERKHLESRRILQGVHVRVDKDGRWMVEGCDTYKLARISNGYVGGKHEWFDFTLPPETVAELKAGYLLTFEPGEDMRCKLVRMARGNVTEWEFNLLDGKYPNTDQLVPEGQPFACYRYAHQLNADYLAVLMGVVKKALGKGENVVFSVQEGKPNRPVVGFAEDGGVEVTLLVMPTKLDEHHKFGNPAPIGRDEKAVKGLRDELKASQANEKMWKEKALKLEQELKGGADKRNAELEGELVKAKADLAKAEKKAERWVKRAEEEKSKRIAQEGDGKLEKRVEKLEKELAKAEESSAKWQRMYQDATKRAQDGTEQLKQARAELDTVWKENARLKAAKPEPKAVPPAPKAPKAEPSESTAAAVSLESLTKWCEGKGLIASQKHEGTCIWVEGESKPYADELAAMGLRFSKKRKSWYINPAA